MHRRSGKPEARSRGDNLLRLTLCLRNNTMSDTSSIHFLAVNHGGCKQTLRLVFPTDAHYTHLPFLANYISQSLNLDRHKTKKEMQRHNCRKQGESLGLLQRDRSQLRSFKMDAVFKPLFKDRALRKRLLPEFDGKSTCDIFCKWPRKRWPTYLYIDS